MNIESDYRGSKMDTNLITAIASNPTTSIGIGVSATILHWVGLLTPCLTFLTLLIGLGAGVYSLLHNRRIYLEDLKQFKDKHK